MVFISSPLFKFSSSSSLILTVSFPVLLPDGSASSTPAETASRLPDAVKQETKSDEIIKTKKKITINFFLKEKLNDIMLRMISQEMKDCKHFVKTRHFKEKNIHCINEKKQDKGKSSENYDMEGQFIYEKTPSIHFSASCFFIPEDTLAFFTINLYLYSDLLRIYEACSIKTRNCKRIFCRNS